MGENAQGNMSLFFCDTRYAELSRTGEKQKTDINNINMDVRPENHLKKVLFNQQCAFKSFLISVLGPALFWFISAVGFFFKAKVKLPKMFL